jgi:hypothetical protein
MAYTLEDVQRLEAAIASGVRRVKFSDREVEYQSLSALRSALEQVKRELGLTQAGFNLHYHQVSKDLGPGRQPPGWCP